MILAATIVIILIALRSLLREVDVRLVLFVAGLALACLALQPLVVFDAFLAEIGNGKTIGPICSAMGYAWVLRATGCDRAMVRLLLAPTRSYKWLLMPAGAAVGFATNVAITSQTASAAAVGPILVPLMLAAGYSPSTAAATLVIGCSGGGSLLNPGDADLVAIHEWSGAPMRAVLQAMVAPLVIGFATAVLAFAIWSRHGAEAAPAEEQELVAPEPRERLKAILPPLPVLLILLMLPGGVLPPLPSPFDKGLPVSHAMLLGTIVVLLVHRRDLSRQVQSFFEGMGYGYVHVISIIVASSCFIAGLTAAGMTDELVRIVSGTGTIGKIAAGFFPGLLAVVSGSGVAPSVAFAKAVLPALRDDAPLALDLGTLAAIGSSFGRTMSPVAAVVIFSASLSGVGTWKLIRRVAPVLLVGYLVVLAVVIARRSSG
ncbi:MAG TPA: C4-dicarboxylate transporter DcuC [Candidatus Binatia bacterium]|nr:C4-dicarboxylate transporter DcuC [Candidatus Binatia bacterium]